jgi:hypothetical protein
MAETTLRENEDHEVWYDVVRGILRHRCRECNRLRWYATGVPTLDNGFTPATERIAHLPACRHHPTGRPAGGRRR